MVREPIRVASLEPENKNHAEKWTLSENDLGFAHAVHTVHPVNQSTPRDNRRALHALADSIALFAFQEITLPAKAFAWFS